MNRRDFIARTAWGSAALWLPALGCQSPPRPDNPAESIVIIGAGAAGLGAAWALQSYGYTALTVLEARDRIGGRVWTSRRWPNTPLDLGASWIHGTRGNPITALAEEAEVTTLATDYDNLTLYGPDGRPLSDDQLARLEELGEDVFRAVMDHISTSDRSLQSILDEAGLGRTPEDHVLINYLINTLIEQGFATDAANLSPLALDFGKDFGGGDVLFPNGYIDIFAQRTEGLDIRTNHVVEAIDYDASGVRIRTTQGEFTADRVIVTLPLGVLKQEAVAFSPALPDSKREAIAALGIGVLNKTYLRFGSLFWPQDSEGLSYISPEKGHWSVWLSMHAYLKKPILAGFNGGAFGRELESWSDQDLVASAMAVLRKIFGSAIPDPDAFQITRWASDPFAYGSYSSLRPGVTEATFEALAQPVGDRLFFAGEATSHTHPATVHGAYLSGQREARRIAQL